MKKSRVLNLLIAPCMILLLSVFLLTFSVNVKASSSSAAPLPFRSSYIETYQTFFVNHNSTWYDRILTHYDVENLDNCAIFIFEGSTNNSSYFYSTCLLTPDNIVGLTPYNEFNNSISISDFDDFTEDYFVCSSSLQTYVWRYKKDNTDFYLYSTNPNNTSNLSFLGNHSINAQGFTFCYPIYIKGSLSVDNVITLTSNTLSPVMLGHATEPINNADLIITEHDLPVHKPTFPTINNYSWTTYVTPTIDTTDLQSVLESIWDSVLYNFNYLFTNIGGLFENLIDNLENFVDFIVDSIFYISNNIVSAIQDFATDFYNNMLSLFEPMFEPIFKIGVFFSTLVGLGTAPGTDEFSVNYLAENLFMPEPDDVQEIMEANDSLHIISNMDRIVDKVWTSETSIIKTLHNVTPVKKFHIPSCIYHGHQIGNFDIEFGWFETYKSYSDIIISTFLIIAWIYWFFVSVSHIIRYGKTYDVDDTTKGVHF